MRTYSTALSTASAGVCIRSTSGRVKTTISAVSAAATTANSATAAPTVRPAASGRFAPMCRPITTVAPVVSPERIIVTSCITALPVPTPETLAASPKRPTTIRSTAP